ncbi:MAG: GNAT family N-acetyltransferase [Anaerolineales bacterium]
MTNRHEYRLSLGFPDLARSTGIEPDILLRAARSSDKNALAELMIDAYPGTVDFDDETIEDAINEIQAYLDGERGGVPLLQFSRLALREDTLLSACLVAEWEQRQQPIVAYIMTRANSKNQGVARYLLTSVLRLLQDAGRTSVGAVITEGNTASERLFMSLGFERVAG